MGRPKSNNVQINISIPMEWKKELENLARIYSVEEGKTQKQTFHMHTPIRRTISLQMISYYKILIIKYKVTIRFVKAYWIQNNTNVGIVLSSKLEKNSQQFY